MSYVLKKARRVTLADVAKEAGLSSATVSTVLNSSEETCPIAPKTRQLVLTAAKRLGYRASWRARALAKQQTRTVGLLYAGEAPFTTGFNQMLLDALAGRLCEHGYHQLFIPIRESNDDYEEILSNDRIDGCLVLAPMPANIEAIQGTGLPTVLVNLDSSLPVAQVLPDDCGGAAAVTRHLIDHGHRHIVFVLMDDQGCHFSAEARTRGFLDTMRAAGLQEFARVVSENQAQRLMADIAAGTSEVTAMVAYEHHLAARLLQSAWKHQIRVPECLSLACFNDVEFLQYLVPALTTVSLPAAELARRAADELIREIENPSGPRTTITLPETLIIRESTGAPRGASKASL